MKEDIFLSCAVALQVPSLAADVEELVASAKAFALSEKLWSGAGVGIVLHGQSEASADVVPVMRVVDLQQLDDTSALSRRSDFGLGLSGRMFSLRI